MTGDIRRILGPTALTCAASADFLREVAAAVAAIAEKFGQAIALDMLYVALLNFRWVIQQLG
jgi:hypothetical protein